MVNRIMAKKQKEDIKSPSASAITGSSAEPHRLSQASKKTSPVKRNYRRKMQISNGHYLNFDHLARLIYALSSVKEPSKTKMSYLEEETGLPFRQVRNRISIGRALGLFKQNSLQLTTLGKLVSSHDPFCDSRATLEYLHYKASGNYVNLIWYEVFNSLLTHGNVMNYKGWMEYFQKTLAGQYTKHSLKDHLGKELRFIIDAYTEQNFQKLLLLQHDESGNLYRLRYTNFVPLVFTAMIYDFCAVNEVQLYQVGEITVTSGSPAMVFGLDAAFLRQQVERLHDRGWLRYETTHNLNQIRLKPGFSAIEFLTAHFESREPHEGLDKL